MATKETTAKKARKYRSKKTLQEHINSMFKDWERGKKAYMRADQTFLRYVLPNMKVGQRVRISLTEEVELVDNFADTNVAFRPARVSRFELKVVKSVKTADVGSTEK